MIVSKLNCVPFHRVNSPLCVPVMQRLPSGVQAKEFTDVLICTQAGLPDDVQSGKWSVQGMQPANCIEDILYGQINLHSVNKLHGQIDLQ